MSETGFSSAWLDLREPADHAARDQHLLELAAECARSGHVVLDLGSGTGSTARAFDGRVPGCSWRFLDADPALLDVAADRHPGSEQVLGDLRDVDALPLDDVGLVTASALLDLMPVAWIEALAGRLKTANIPLYAALNYDGRMAWTPGTPDDQAITASFNQHQGTDKGLGPAAGPEAAGTAKRVFGSVGFDVRSADSPWTLDPGQSALQGELITGIASAASEVGNSAADSWLSQRRQVLPDASMLVGHTDILARPN